MERKRILITGAAGFLGSHLCDRFIKDDYHVIAMDNLITGPLKNIEHLFPLENYLSKWHISENVDRENFSWREYANRKTGRQAWIYFLFSFFYL